MRFIEVSQISTDAMGEDRLLPTMIDAGMLRCFYPRKENKPGTRLTFADGGGFAISENLDELKAKLPPKFVRTLVELSQITGQVSQSMEPEPETGEDDEEDFVDPVITETFTKTFINPAYVRCFYPRKVGEEGTRITFTEGGFAVTESFARVAELLGAPAPTSNVVGLVEHQQSQTAH